MRRVNLRLAHRGQGLRWLFVVALALTSGHPALAAELKAKTVEAFERYARATEARIAQETADPNGILWLDHLPADRQKSLREELRNGEIIIERLETRENGRRISIPDGLAHHWIAVVFVPDVKLPQTLALLQDYDHHQDIYKPDVQRSKLLSQNGDEFRVYLRFYRKAIVTAVFNTEIEVRYHVLDATQAYSESRSTRIAEVENPGETDEQEKPVGRDRGFLWRVNSYWKLEEGDGGIYIELETIALSRTVPLIYHWLVNPLLKSIPKSYLTRILAATRQALTSKKSLAAQAGSSRRRKSMSLSSHELSESVRDITNFSCAKVDV